MWFKQEGPRPLSTYDRVIALNSSNHTAMGINWPPYSPDFNPCDFFLRGNLKNNVYANNHYASRH